MRRALIGLVAFLAACGAPPAPPFPAAPIDLARPARRADRSKRTLPGVRRRPSRRRRALAPLGSWIATRASWYDERPAACYDRHPGGRTTVKFPPRGLRLWTANRTLPCGTEVEVRYHGRMIRVPVWDRGPYVADRDLDLSLAAFSELADPYRAGVIDVDWRVA